MLWRATGIRPTARGRRGPPPWVRTVLLYVVTLFAVTSVVFMLPRAMPGDPIQQREDPSNSLYINDQETRDRLMAYYGLDKPLYVQYAEYLGRVVRGDLGWSIDQNMPVSTLIARRLPWTALLMGTSVIAASAISFVAGLAAAWRRGRPSDRLLVVVMTGIRSVPEYAIASTLLIAFAVAIPVLPLYGGSTPFAEYSSFFDHAKDVAEHLALPATSLTIGLLGAKFLMVRNTVISALGEDFMVLARAKGLSTRRMKYQHAGRNALLPFLTMLGIQIGFAVGGSIFVETVFAYPGMGSLIMSAVNSRDYPVLEGTFLTLAGAVLFMNMAIELVYRRFDPRVGAR